MAVVVDPIPEGFERPDTVLLVLYHIWAPKELEIRKMYDGDYKIELGFEKEDDMIPENELLKMFINLNKK